MFPESLQQTIPKNVRLYLSEEGEEEEVSLHFKVHKSWAIVEHVTVFMVMLLLFCLLQANFQYQGGFLSSILKILLLVITAGLMLLLALPIATWFKGQSHILITAEGIAQQLYIGPKTTSRVRKVPWKEIQLIALVMTGNDRSYREIQVVRRGGRHPFWFKDQYSEEQLFYLEQCLQVGFKKYGTYKDNGREEGVDWSDHLIE